MQGSKAYLYKVIFEHDTKAGKLFDVVLLWSIVFSIVVVLLESIPSFQMQFGQELRWVEWSFTILFSLEFLLRIYCFPKPLSYLISFFGLVDLLALIPTYLSLFIGAAPSLLVIRGLRLLRVFRVFKLSRYTGEARILVTALRASREKITVFLGSVLSLVLIMGALMYLVEGEAAGFSSIPKSIYWAIVTLTTVGYGDLVPITPLGQALAAFIMICGYAIIAVPTGIVSVELANADRQDRELRICRSCHNKEHLKAANYCMKCGSKI